MKLPAVSGMELVKFLSKRGFEVVGRKGSHVRMKQKTPSGVFVTVVPLHKRVDAGTLLGILRQCGIAKDEFASHFGVSRAGRMPR